MLNARDSVSNKPNKPLPSTQRNPPDHDLWIPSHGLAALVLAVSPRSHIGELLLVKPIPQILACFFPKAPAKGFSLSTAAYFIFLNLFLLLHLPHSLFLTLFLLLHLPHSLFLTLFILLHLPYFIFFTNFLLLHPHNIII